MVGVMVDQARFMQDIRRIQSDQIGHVAAAPDKAAETAFKTEFEKKLTDVTQDDGVKFSSHAIQRLFKRNIDIKPEEINRINQAVAKAQQKGSRESLVMVDDLALIVSVKNKTVITAMDRPSMKDQVITNIDSAILG